MTTSAPASQANDIGGLFGPSYRRPSIGIVALVFLVAFEAMAVATAMPLAVRALSGIELYAWAFSGITTASMFATVVAGVLADRFGALPPLLAGVASFAVGLVVAGTAVNMIVFIAGRMVQGLGAGAIIVSVYVTVAQAYSERVRPRAFAALAGAWVLPALVGPFAAGAIAEHVGWRWVFLGLLPLVVLPLVLVVPTVRSLPRPAAGAAAGARSRRGVVLSALAAAVGIALLQYAGQHLYWAGLLALVLGLALLVPSLPRLLPAGTLRLRRGLPSIVLMRGVLAGAFMGAEAFVPLMLVEYRHLSATQAGLALTLSAIGWFGGSWLQGRPGLRADRRRLVQLGAISVATGITVVLLALSPAVTPWVATLAWAVAGFGMGLSLASLSVLLFELSPKEEQGANSAALQMSDAFGTIVMLGLAGAFFAAIHERATPPWIFGPIYVVMASVALAGLVVAARVKPRGADG
ncbi:MFS transporter [Flindersiella endophytica]